MVTSFFSRIAQSFTNNLITEQRYQMILEGLQVTLLITFCSAILGTLLGGLVCWARMSRRPWLRRAAIIYIDLMRGTPVLVFLMLMYYVFMAPLDASGITVAIVTFAMNMSAYAGEMIRSAIEGIDRGQSEAGLALGYSSRKTFLRIILPQVIRQILPVYLGEVISLLKGTSIVGYIAVVDMTRASDLIRSRTFDAFFPLILTAAIYFLVAWFIGIFLNGLVHKQRTRAIVASAMLVLLGLLGSVPDWFTVHRPTPTDSQSAPPIFARLEGKKVATIIGSVQDIALTRYAPDADILRFTSYSDLLVALESRKIDVVLMENMTITANKNMLAIVDTIDAGLPAAPIGACFKLDNTELQQDFNQFIAQIRADGTYREVVDLWLNNDEVFSVPAPKQTGTGKELKIATFSGFPPFNYISSNAPAGFEIDLLTRWANSRNYRLEFMMMDFASQIPAIQTGKADLAIGSISNTEERRKQALFSDGYFESRMLFYTRKGESAILTAEIETTEKKNATWLLAGLIVFVALAMFVIWLRHFIRRITKADSTLPPHDSTTGSSLISVSHLGKRFGNLEVLKDVSFEVNPGEVISIIGPSGTGKSTLLRALNMLEPPTSGDILVSGAKINEKGYPLHLLRRKIGMVFQSFNLFDHMTVLENIIDAPTHLLHVPEEQAKEEAMALLKKVGMTKKADAYPSSLSGGQKQRVAIARALAMYPEVILFDEPTSALDPTMVGEVLSVIRQLAKSGLTMLIVTHEMRFARDVSTRIFFMNEGVIWEDGTPRQIFENPVHSATKTFVQRIQKLVYEIDSDDYDFLQIHTGIKQFCIKYNISEKGERAYSLVKEVLFTHMCTYRPLTLRLTHAELSGVTALDFMVEGLDSSPLNDTARESLRPQISKLVEETTSRGFRVKLIL